MPYGLLIFPFDKRTKQEHSIENLQETMMKKYMEDALAILSLSAFGYVVLLWGSIGEALVQ